MNRTPWTVEEELSRLKAEIQEKQGESPPGRIKSREDGPQQQIQGHHNVQLGGDLTVHARKEVNPNHPEAIRCPQYRALTYRRSGWCAECHFNLRDDRIELAKKEKRRRLLNMILFCGIPGLLILFTGTTFFAGTNQLYLFGVGHPLGVGRTVVTAQRAALIRRHETVIA